MLVGATTLFSVMQFPVLHQHWKEIYNSKALKAYYNLRKNLAVEVCLEQSPSENLSRKAIRESCLWLKNALRPGDIENPIFTLGRLETHMSKDFNSTISASQRQEVASLFLDRSEELLESKRYSTLQKKYKKQEIEKDMEKEVTPLFKKRTLLAKQNLSTLSLLKAQFIHADFGHLIGNMVFLFIFASALEQRIGLLGLLSCYLLSGFAGLFSQTMLQTSNWSLLLGASANVFGVAGAFLALFFHQNLKVWVSAGFIWNRVIRCPVWIFVLFFIIIDEFTGVMQSQRSGVAHYAHIGGLAVGFLFGFAWKWVHPLDKRFTFPYQSELFAKAKKSLNPKEAFQIFRYLLFYDPTHERILLDALELVGGKGEAKSRRSWNQLRNEEKRFFEDHFDELFRLVNQKAELTPQVFDLVGDGWPWKKLIQHVELRTLMNLFRNEAAERRLLNARALAEIGVTFSRTPAVRSEFETKLIEVKREREQDGIQKAA